MKIAYFSIYIFFLELILNDSFCRFTTDSDFLDMHWELETATIEPAEHFTFLKMAVTLTPLSRSEKLQVIEEMLNGLLEQET